MLSEVPEGWDKARIDAVLQRNTTSVSVTELAAEGLVAHYSLPAFDANKKPVIESGSEIKSNKTAIDKDCLLFSKLNPRIPRVWRVRHFGEQKPVCSTEFWALKPKTGEVSLSYAEYFLGWNGFLSHPTIKPASSTNSHQRVDRKAFDAFMLPLPPLNEQHRIAEILSSVDASIQATQAVIEQAERVKRGLMEELLTGGLGSEAIERGEVPEGWALSSLGEAGKLYAGGTPNRKTAEFYEPAEIAWVKSGELRQGLITETEEFISQLGLDKSSAKLVPADTPVLAMYGATAGEVGWLSMEAATNQAVLACEPKQGIDGKFLYYSLKNASQSLIARQQGGAQPNLSKSLVSSFEIALPPLSEQRHIAKVLSDIDDFLLKQATIVQQQNRTKRGLMDDLLTGKVRTV